MVPIFNQIKKKYQIANTLNLKVFFLATNSLLRSAAQKSVDVLPHCCFFATPTVTKTTVRQRNKANGQHNGPSNQAQFRLP
jgi:hypothetical protein